MSVVKKLKGRVIREFFKTCSYTKVNVVDELLTGRPFDFSPPWEARYLAAMQWNFKHHLENSEFYRKLCAYKGRADYKIRTFDDIWDIPFILTEVFKSYFVDTRTKNILRAEFNSSGTSGRKSRIMIDIVSGQRLLFSIYQIYKTLGLVEAAPANYLMMAYNPEVDDSIGTTNSDVVISHFAPRKDIFYALDHNKKREIEFLKDKAVERLKYFVDEGLPIRILGFVHHACEVIKAYNERYGRLLFPEKSYILTGGGWKGAVNPYGRDFDLFTFMRNSTNIDMRNIRDLYTLNEHAIFYLECEKHNMHIPNVALVCVREPHSLRRLSYGQTGLIHLYTPLIESAPLLSILTTDYGYIKPSCDCAAGGPYIKITGRAGLMPKMTCAFTADRYVDAVGMEGASAK